MYSDKQLQEIRSHANNCTKKLGPLKLEDPSDLYPLVAIASNESDILRFTKSVVLITQEFNISSSPALLPTIHLYGPENLGNYEIIHCHPVIRPPSGKGMGALQKPKINLHLTSNIDDISRINGSYKDYLPYFQSIFKITNTIQPDDLISLCYDLVLKRPKIDGSHNLMTIDESICDTVISSICRNALRMMRDKTVTQRRFIPHNETRHLSRITNSCNNVECLKDGTLNNITTFLAIYSLNALEFPSTIDHICLTLSTRYQHKFEELNKYIKKEYNSISEYKDLRERLPNSPHVRKALDIEREVETIKKRVYQIVEQSVDQLKKDKIVVSEGKKFIPNADSLMIQTTNGFQEIEMPSVETIRKRKNSITKFNLYLDNKRKEWKNN